jgi:hypothetical protein
MNHHCSVLLANRSRQTSVLVTALHSSVHARRAADSSSETNTWRGLLKTDKIYCGISLNRAATVNRCTYMYVGWPDRVIRRAFIARQSKILRRQRGVEWISEVKPIPQRAYCKYDSVRNNGEGGCTRDRGTPTLLTLLGRRGCQQASRIEAGGHRELLLVQ